MMKRKLLIVEDNIIISFHLKLIMDSVGFETFSITHGEEVDGFVRSNSPDLIFMDIMLAGSMDGIEATRLVRTHSQVPVVFMTALTDDDSKRELNTITNSYLFKKPFDEAELISLAKKLLEN